MDVEGNADGAEGKTKVKSERKAKKDKADSETKGKRPRETTAAFSLGVCSSNLVIRGCHSFCMGIKLQCCILAFSDRLKTACISAEHVLTVASIGNALPPTAGICSCRSRRPSRNWTCPSSALSRTSWTLWRSSCQSMTSRLLACHRQTNTTGWTVTGRRCTAKTALWPSCPLLWAPNSAMPQKRWCALVCIPVCDNAETFRN